MSCGLRMLMFHAASHVGGQGRVEGSSKEETSQNPRHTNNSTQVFYHKILMFIYNTEDPDEPGQKNRQTPTVVYRNILAKTYSLTSRSPCQTQCSTWLSLDSLLSMELPYFY